MKYMNALFTQSWCSFKMIFNGRSKHTRTQILKRTNTYTETLVYLCNDCISFRPVSFFQYNAFQFDKQMNIYVVVFLTLLLSFFAATATIRTYFTAMWKYESYVNASEYV